MPEAPRIQIGSVEFRGSLVGWLVGWSFTNSSQATCVISQLVVKEIGCVFAGTPRLWDRKQEQAIAPTLLQYTQQK